MLPTTNTSTFRSLSFVEVLILMQIICNQIFRTTINEYGVVYQTIDNDMGTAPQYTDNRV